MTGDHLVFVSLLLRKRLKRAQRLSNIAAIDKEDMIGAIHTVEDNTECGSAGFGYVVEEYGTIGIQIEIRFS